MDHGHKKMLFSLGKLDEIATAFRPSVEPILTEEGRVVFQTLLEAGFSVTQKEFHECVSVFIQHFESEVEDGTKTV
jgi:hypothetical protein